jgi:hypothetical protein
MAKNKRYNTVSDLMADVLPKDQFVHELQQQIDRRRLVRSLPSLRNSKRISQDAIAKEADCGQSRISKLADSFAIGFFFARQCGPVGGRWRNGGESGEQGVVLATIRRVVGRKSACGPRLNTVSTHCA